MKRSRAVRGCRSCPFYSDGYQDPETCTAADASRDLMANILDTRASDKPPAWCPLPVLVTLESPRRVDP